MNVLYRADGSPTIGTGHIIRGLVLRRQLQAMGARVKFLTRGFPWGVDNLREAGCEPLVIPADADERAEIGALQAALKSLPASGGQASAAACVMDVLETDEALTHAVKAAGCGLVCLDDVGPGRLNADAIINVLETEPAPEALRDRGIALHEGPQYAALPEGYADPGIGEREVPAKVRGIIITLGGADPGALAPKAARAVRQALESQRAGTAFVEPRVLVLTGPASSQALGVASAAQGVESLFTIAASVPSLLPELRKADLGIIAGGLTMHEALAVGLPCIALCQPVRHQAELAQRFTDCGAMLSLGRGAEATEERICEAVLDLAADADLRRRLGARGVELVDGRGAQRTAQVICSLALRRPWET